MEIPAADGSPLIARNQTALLGWVLALLGVGVVQVLSDLGQEYFVLEPRSGSAFRTLRFVTRRTCDLGATVGRRGAAGDLVTVGVSDIEVIGNMMDDEARGVGGVVSFAVVAVLMLSVSWQAGLLVLAGVPVILLITTRVVRVLGSWRRKVRERQRELTDEAVDIVRGLRVIRGIEGFVSDVLALPPEIVEDADAGDLITRTSRDVDLLSLAVRAAIPQSMAAAGTIVFTVGAMALVSPLLLLPCALSVPLLFGGTRWYLRRAQAGYLREASSYSRMTEGLAETVQGARTVEALRLTARRMDRVNADIASSYAAQRYTRRLRNVFYPLAGAGYVLPASATLLIGGTFYLHGMVSLAGITAGTAYAAALLAPLDLLMFWLNEIQSAGAALARLLGIAQFRATAAVAESVASDSVVERADGIGGVDSIDGVDGGAWRGIVVRDLRYAYQPGHDVLRGVDLTIRQGEWLAVVGPSGAGKSTFAKLLAGIYEPRTGSITTGGQEITRLPLAKRRRKVALVTQEHHVFRGTVRDNLAIASPGAGDDELAAALTAVDAWEWAGRLGLGAAIGPGGEALDPAKIQQLALARLILANPDALILDEATSMLNPGAARHLERSLAAVTRGRTVIAIVHRLHTARDADRIAVFSDGRIAELGTHEDLLGLDGSYGALWRAWQGSPASSRSAAVSRSTSSRVL